MRKKRNNQIIDRNYVMPMERAESDVVLLFLTNIRIRISVWMIKIYV